MELKNRRRLPDAPLRATAVRSVGWAGLETWGKQVLTLVIFVVLSRLLSPADFGVVAVAMVVIGLLELLTVQGFPTAIVQLPSIACRHLDAVFALGLVSAIVLGTCAYFGAPLIAALLQTPDATAVLRVLAVLLPLAALTAVPTGILRREMRFRQLSRRTLSATAVGGIAGISMAAMGYGVWSLVGQHLVRSLVGTIWLLAVVDWRPRIRLSAHALREVLPTSVSILGTSLVSFGYTRMDRAIIGAFLGAAMLGHYAVGTRIVQLVRDAIVSPMNSVAESAFSAVQDEHKRLYRAYYTLTRVATVIGFPICAGLALTAHLSIPLIFGSKWMPAVPVVQILSITGALHMLFIGTHPLAVARGKVHIILVLNLMHSVLAIAGAWIGTGSGLSGAATGIAVAWLISALIGFSVLCRVLGVQPIRLLQSAGLATGGAVIMSATVFGVLFLAQRSEMVAWVQLTICIVVGAAVYAGTVLVMTPRPFDQVREQLRIIRLKTTTQSDSGPADCPGDAGLPQGIGGRV